MTTMKELRINYYISRRELSDLSGVAESTIVRLENGTTRVTKEVADKLLKALSERTGQQLTMENVEGLELYNPMRDRRLRSKTDEHAA